GIGLQVNLIIQLHEGLLFVTLILSFLIACFWTWKPLRIFIRKILLGNWRFDGSSRLIIPFLFYIRLLYIILLFHWMGFHVPFHLPLLPPDFFQYIIKVYRFPMLNF